MADQTQGTSSIIILKSGQEVQSEENQLEGNKDGDENVNNIPSQHFQHVQNKLLIKDIYSYFIASTGLEVAALYD